MKYYPLLLITVTALLTLLAGCGTSNSLYEEKLKQDDYLKRSYPAKKPQSRETPAIKTNFYDEISAGRVVEGMSLLESLAASKTVPYGPNRYNTVYWCDQQPADRCDARCAQCAAVLLTDQSTHLLQGHGDQLFVVKSLPRQEQDNVATLKGKPLTVVTALFQNKVVPGMTVKDFKRIRRQPGSKTQYYCKNQRVFQSCLLSCSDCTLKIISPGERQFHIRTVRFRGHMDYATIVDVNDSVQASLP